jgi:L-threonylcarbamoyladenylate synthase
LPQLLPTHTPALFAAAVACAAELLRAGEVVALPTETVYGLAANALDPRAVAKIFSIKGRPAHNPIIVHVADLAMARSCSRAWPASADALARAFWPGPLTIVLPRAANIPDIVTAGGDTVGIRWPSHPFIQAVIRACGFPLAAPSANPSNQISPTNAAHVATSLGEKIPLIIDGGQAQVGIESTVVDLAAAPPRLLRPGMISADSLNAALASANLQLAETPAPESPSSSAPLRSPGQLEKHYSPRARLVVLAWRDENDLARALEKFSIAASRVNVIAHTRVPLGGAWGRVSVIPHDAEAFARALYAELHHCDDADAELIVVEALPDAPEWQGIADRLRRAAA